MNAHEVAEPILNSPFEEPGEHWRIMEHEPPERRSGRRPAMYFYRRPGRESSTDQQGVGTAIGLKLVNRIRSKLAEWRPLALRGEGGVSRTTMELMRYWRREERRHRLFFAQLEAAETIIFLTEARADFNRGINLCIDLSATPYYLGRVGQDTNRPFPWVVSDFGLVDAIESGLVKIPQLAVRDTSGSPIPGYFNIWRWIQPRLTSAERGGRRGRVKPEAILKYAHVPVAMLGGLWEVLRQEWSERNGDPRPPVFIIVCNDTALAKVVYRWLAEDEAPVGIPPARMDGLRNSGDAIRTIRVDSKVVRESDEGGGGPTRTGGCAFRWTRWARPTGPKTGSGGPSFPTASRRSPKSWNAPSIHRAVRCVALSASGCSQRDGTATR